MSCTGSEKHDQKPSSPPAYLKWIQCCCMCNFCWLKSQTTNWMRKSTFHYCILIIECCWCGGSFAVRQCTMKRWRNQKLASILLVRSWSLGGKTFNLFHPHGTHSQAWFPLWWRIKCSVLEIALFSFLRSNGNMWPINVRCTYKQHGCTYIYEAHEYKVLFTQFRTILTLFKFDFLPCQPYLGSFLSPFSHSGPLYSVFRFFSESFHFTLLSPSFRIAPVCHISRGICIFIVIQEVKTLA